jgi:hypothetical protein
VGLFGPNADGELLEPGRVPDCHLGLLVFAGDRNQAPGVLVVSPAGLLHPAVPQPDGMLLYELVTGHPDRAPQELVFLADLTVELRAWPHGSWARLGVDPQAAASAVIGCWQGGHLPGRQVGGLTAEDALALERPAMTLARAWLRDRLAGQLSQASRPGRHPTNGRRPGDSFR